MQKEKFGKRFPASNRYFLFDIIKRLFIYQTNPKQTDPQLANQTKRNPLFQNKRSHKVTRGQTKDLVDQDWFKPNHNMQPTYPITNKPLLRITTIQSIDLNVLRILFQSCKSIAPKIKQHRRALIVEARPDLISTTHSLKKVLKLHI